MFETVGLSFEERQQVESLLAGFDSSLQDTVASLFDGLNREQISALSHPLSAGRPLLIVAGAGSGKTSVLTRRVTLLLLAGITPQQLFVSTFTVKAAGEMKVRIGHLITSLAQTAQQPLRAALEHLVQTFPLAWIGTFHSLCLRLLRERDSDGFSPIEEMGYPPTFNIISEAESREILKSILADLPTPPDVREVSAVMDLAANELLTPESLAERKIYGGLDAAVVGEVWKRYQEGKRESGKVDFTDLLYLAATALADRRRCAQRWKGRFTHVLIDEYQDTNIAQYAIATELAAAKKNVFVVGDDDQSIYGFRGADVRNIRAFTQDYPESRVVRLIRNYRSTPVILGAANAILADRPDSAIDKTLLASAKSDGKIPEKIMVYEAQDDQDELQFVTFQIKELIGEGYAYRDIVIFYRVHELAAPVLAALRSERIPFVEVGGKSLMDLAAARSFRAVFQAVSVLRLKLQGSIDLIRHGDILRGALRELWKTGKFGPRNREDREMLMALPAPERVILDEAGYVEAVQRCKSGETQRHLEVLWSGLYGAAQSIDSLPPADLLNFLVDALGINGLAEEDPEVRKGLVLVRRFVSSRLPYAAAGSAGLDQLLSGFQAADEGEPVADLLQENVVRLLTIHASKGLEFPVVIVVGVEEDILPYVRPGSYQQESADERREREEEELRLFYVAITRAKQRLILTGAARRPWYGRDVTHRPSRYLARLPDDVVIRGSSLSTVDRAAHRTKQFFKDMFGV